MHIFGSSEEKFYIFGPKMNRKITGCFNSRISVYGWTEYREFKGSGLESPWLRCSTNVSPVRSIFTKALSNGSISFQNQ